ncbi:uncharacterized protein DUF4386 [Glaciihabitans tibetensis]|uniref:Uncharacterized protein DUF4386 n=1 Tax=Glaciihabitans tibetensis TaxID=1266600 RepID=A0A2T0VFZ7_9MICO|nr:DUF4386 domain-containing protein [Glaciihabitans tibetensis]PRY69121.1 uncharacterized protein DUF4386 [Glaciihabitans tibetensis]
MDPTRKTAIIIGVLFLLTEVGAIVGRLLYRPVLGNPAFVLESDPATSVYVGVLFEVVLIIAVVGTAVAAYPVLKRQNEALALAYVAARILEAAIVAVGTLSLLTVLMLRQQPGGSNDAARETVAGALLALQDGTLLFGPGFALGVGSLLLASLMYGSRLVPRPLALLGLVGGAAITLSTVAVIFGLYGQFSTTGLLAALPVFAWELGLALWLIIRGFSAIDSPKRIRRGSTSVSAGLL